MEPRKQCLLDFEKWADKAATEGQRVIVLTNANQSLDDKTELYNLCNTMKKCSLESAREAKHAGTSLRSLDRGTKTIDHIFTQGVDAADIHRVGQLPFGLGFHSDHRGAFADMERDKLLVLRMHKPEQRDFRQLSSKNAKHRQQYVGQLSTHLEAHDVLWRIRKLSSSCQMGSLDKEKFKEYNKIDNCITEGMLAAEKSLPYRREQGWTAKVNTLICCI